MIPDSIKTRFAPWSGCECWAMCNKDKKPVTIHSGNYLIPTVTHPSVPFRYSMCSLLRWKREPQDHIATLPKIKNVVDKFTGYYGFGVMLGLHNTLVCFDFDHCISPDGSISERVREFLDVILTFVETSSSGTGLHVFVAVEGNTEEYDFRKEVCDGKCYDKRFIKLTGNIFEDYDYPIKIISEHEFNAVKRKLGNIDPITTKFTGDSVFTGNKTDWPDILTKSGIRFEVIPNYANNVRRHGDIERVSVWAAKIQCPNCENHTDFNRRRNEFNRDVAILTLWNDKTTSVTCNHNHCSPIYRPNLLKQLWGQVKENSPIAKKHAETREILKSLGVL